MNRGIDATVPPTDARHCGLLLSGGIDSALLACMLGRDGWCVQAIWVDYGQAAASAERSASQDLASHYRLDWRQIKMDGMNVPLGGEVPGRNDMLVATARACMPGTSVAIGVHAGTSYADCAAQWVDGWRTLLDWQHGGAVSLLAPLVSLRKPEVLALAKEYDVPIILTHSCDAGPVPCGQCLSCLDRQML